MNQGQAVSPRSDEERLLFRKLELGTLRRDMELSVEWSFRDKEPKTSLVRVL